MKKSRTLSVLCLSVLSMQLWAQSPAPAANDTPATKAASDSSDLKDLRDRIAKQEQQLKALEQSLESQRALLEQAMKQAASTPAPAPAPVQPASDNGAAKIVPVVNATNTANRPYFQHPETQPSPLSINIGNTTFTPLGFMDATFFARSTNVASGIGTNFAGIPFGNTAAGHLGETNFSAQNSRIGFRVDSDFMGWKMLGYFETDFLFNNDANSFQIGSNSAALRLRNYFVDANNGKFEFLAGQDWSMMTPNRKGISPLPSDIFYSQDMDTNYQIGLVWTRAPQFRFIYHPNENVAIGVALENPQQYVGGGNGSGAATLPNNLASISGQFQGNNNITGVPNSMPDIQAKVAIDGHMGGRTAHVEVAGLLSGFRDYLLPSVGGITSPGTHRTLGGGGEINSNLELFKNFHLIENAFASDGEGRYVFGEAPDFIVRPNGTISPVHSYSTVDGFEAQVTPKTLFAAYYGGLYAAKDIAYDPSAVAKSTPQYVGYGYSGVTGYGAANTSQNRYIQELTFDWVQTLWKSKAYGSLSLINQYSYVFREPWAEPNGTPKQAHTNMVWIDVRYTLP